MVRTYTKKAEGGRNNFSNSQEMIDAYNAVLRKQMSINKASVYFGVNKKSLLRRIHGVIPINAQVGRQTVLSVAQETELADCIKLLAGWGWGFSGEEVKNIVQEFVLETDMKTTFTEGRPGKDWLSAFIKRHPDIVPRKTEQLGAARARAEDPFTVERWFYLLDQELTKNGVKDMSAQIFNVDESGFVTDPKTQVVLAERGSKRVTQNIGGSGREQITVNCAGAASGRVLPPFVVYQGKNLYLAWTQGGPDGTSYTTSAKGWMEAPQFLEWFEKIFLKFTADVADKTRILIFDGHASHLSLALVEKARQNNVVLLKLPAHLTHLLQPFDRAVFRPVKVKWQALLLKFSRNNSGPVSKKLFPAMLKKLFEQSFTSDTIRAGFSCTGICPYNPKAVVLETRPQVYTAAILVVPVSSPMPTTLASEIEALLSTSSSSGPSASYSPGPSASYSPGPSASYIPGPSASYSPASYSPGPSASYSPASYSPEPSASYSPEPSASYSSSTTPASPALSSTAQSTLKDFFLKQLQPRFSSSGRGRSARIERFRYGESLTSEECVTKCQEAAAQKEAAAARGRGRGRGRGRARGRGMGVAKGRGKRRSRCESSSRSVSPLQTEDEQCRRCGQPGGAQILVQCDICDSWFHYGCSNTQVAIEELADEEWICDFCTQ